MVVNDLSEAYTVDAEQKNHVQAVVGMSGIKWVFFGIVVWLVFSFLGILLPVFLGLVFLLFVAPIVGGYLVGRSGKIILIVIFSLVTSALAGVIGLATIGSVPPERQKNVTGIGWSSNTEILVWVCFNGLLSLITGYLKSRFNRNNQF
jgi:hypothetical protein